MRRKWEFCSQRQPWAPRTSSLAWDPTIPGPREDGSDWWEQDRAEPTLGRSSGAGGAAVQPQGREVNR